MKNFYNKRIWQLVITICATLVAIYVPLNIVLGLVKSVSLTFFYWFITLIFIVVLVIICIYPAREISQQENIIEARSKYFRSWFIIDLIAAIPFTFIFGSPVLGVLRLLKFVRVAQFMHQVRQKAVRFGDYLLLAFFIFWLLIIAHWFSCGWIALWEFPAETDKVSKYITSLYWVVETLSTVGYGEVTPVTNAQHIYAMVIMLFGVGVYGFIIGNVANLLSKRNPARAQFFNNLEQLKVFVNYRSIPMSLQKKS
jgi:hypothetical protein